MWLTGRLAPDFKTIADFRRDNGAGIRNVCRRFVQLCRELRLFTQAIVAIDSSKFKAVNSRDRNFTPGKVDKRQQQIEQSIGATWRRWRPPTVLSRPRSRPRPSGCARRSTRLREQMRRMDTIREELKRQPDGQISQTDPDARSMVSQAKGTGLVGYNVQAVVDARHHLIVAHEVTNVGSDRAQLTKMGTAARDQRWTRARLQAVADRGYFSGPEIKACIEAGITPLVPKPMTSNAKAEGRFSKADFIYVAKDDEYQCPAGERAIHRMTTVEHGLSLHKYWSSACPHCPLKTQCTTSRLSTHHTLGA